MFRNAPGLKSPVRVYRGLSSASVVRASLEKRRYWDPGFTSASTELLPAMVYAGEEKAVLVLELPKGYKAVSICKMSRNPQEKEILLPRDVAFEVLDADGEAYNGYTLIYGRPL